MTRECIVAIYDDFEKASTAVHALESASYPTDQVSLVTHSVEGEVPQTAPIQVGDSAEQDAAKGAGAGGLIGLLLGAPLLAIPGIGPILIAGPLAVGLTGAIVGGFLGSMAGWGVHEDHVANYEQQVREGAVLVVATGGPEEVADAQRILNETEAQSVEPHVSDSSDDVSP